MQSDFEDLLRAAEDHYLQNTDINSFKQQVDALQDRLALYEVLRDQELTIFQAVADQLQKETFSNPQADLDKVLTHWISMLRYSAMAMLRNQPEILEHQLGWLADVVGDDAFSALNQKLSEQLHQALDSVLTEDQMTLIQSFLQQADTALVREDSSKELAVLG